MPARAAPRPPGCCCRAAATTRAWRSCRASTRTSRRATRRIPARCVVRSSRPSSSPASSATSRRASTRAPRCSSAAPSRRSSSTRGSGSTQRFSPNVDNKMTIAQEEIFGPVLVVIPYDDEDDAVRIANDSVYGLAGNVMSSSLDRSLAVARRLRAGFIGLNGTAGYGADTPFGGYKDSGVGRQNGLVGFSQYTEVKSVAYPADTCIEGAVIVRSIRRPRGLRVVRRRRLRRRAGSLSRSWPGCGGRSRSSGSTCPRCPARRASPSSSCTATRMPSRCCATT